MPVSADDIIRITVRFTNVDSGEVANVFYMRMGGTGEITDAACIGAVGSWLGAIYAYGTGFITNDQAVAGYDIVTVEWVAGRIVEVSIVGSALSIGVTWGSGTNNPVPEGAAAVITFPTTVPKTRGRKFLGVLDNSAISSTGELISGAVSAFGNWAAGVLADLVVSGLVGSAGVIKTIDGTFVPFSSAVVRENSIKKCRKNTT